MYTFCKSFDILKVIKECLETKESSINGYFVDVIAQIDEI